MSVEGFRPGAEKLGRHLSRYPRHYGALGVFLVAMLLVPTVSGVNPLEPIGAGAADLFSAPDDDSETAGEPPGDAGSAPSAPVTQAPPAPTEAPTTAPPPVPETEPSVPSSPPTLAPAPPQAAGDDDGSGFPIPLPTLPPLPIPALPSELQPIVAAVGPLTTQGCSAIGLAGVVLAIAGPGLGETLPIAELLNYVTPVYSVCALFPPPEESALICAVDEAAHDAGYPADVAGLMKTPNPIGLGVDTLVRIDAAFEAYTGSNPGLSAPIVEQLGCH